MTIPFSRAIEELRTGRKVARYTWPEGEFLYLVNGSQFKVNREPLLSLLPEGTDVAYLPHIDKMRAFKLDAETRYISEVWVPTSEELMSQAWKVLP